MDSVPRRPDFLAAALAAARRGWPVFPVEPGGKHLAITRWEQRATTDLDVIERAWTGPRAGHNIGGPPGRAGCLVLDLDCHADLPDDWLAIPGVKDGADVFACLLEWAGESRWPATTWIATPSGGYHLWFRQPPIRNSAGLLGPGIDVRGVGGYVLCPGSVVGGRVYELLDDSPPAPLPLWLARRLAPKPQSPRPFSLTQADTAGGRLAGLARIVRDSQPGDRTGPLVWAAHRLAEMVAAGQSSTTDGEVLVQDAVAAGINGGERYARYQVEHVLRRGGTR
jgi:Bifunctional DNA primase/polymerase, N-terminal